MPGTEREPPTIELDRDHHNGHLNDEEQGFDKCYPVIVHARSEDEAVEIAEVLTEHYRSVDSETDQEAGRDD